MWRRDPGQCSLPLFSGGALRRHPQHPGPLPSGPRVSFSRRPVSSACRRISPPPSRPSAPAGASSPRTARVPSTSDRRRLSLPGSPAQASARLRHAVHWAPGEAIWASPTPQGLPSAHLALALGTRLFRLIDGSYSVVGQRRPHELCPSRAVVTPTQTREPVEPLAHGNKLAGDLWVGLWHPLAIQPSPCHQKMPVNKAASGPLLTDAERSASTTSLGIPPQQIPRQTEDGGGALLLRLSAVIFYQPFLSAGKQCKTLALSLKLVELAI